MKGTVCITEINIYQPNLSIILSIVSDDKTTAHQAQVTGNLVTAERKRQKLHNGNNGGDALVAKVIAGDFSLNVIELWW